MLIWTTNIGCISAYNLLFIRKKGFNGLSCLSFLFCLFFFFVASCGCLQAVQLLCEHKCPINIKDLVRTSSPVVHFSYFRAFTILHSSQSQVQQFKVMLCLYFYLDFSGGGSSPCGLS